MLVSFIYFQSLVFHPNVIHEPLFLAAVENVPAAAMKKKNTACGGLGVRLVAERESVCLERFLFFL